MKWSIPERIIERGRRYASEGRVVEISQDKKRVKWLARVVGSQVYYVELDGTPREEDYCSCPYFKDWGYCKHTVAVELALREAGYSRVFSKTSAHLAVPKGHQEKIIHHGPTHEEMLLHQAIDLVMTEQTQTVNPEDRLQVEFVIQGQEVARGYYPTKVLLVGLRLGYENGRLYVVRDIQEFFRVFKEQGVYQTAQGEYSFAKENFATEDYACLVSLSDAYDHQQFLQEDSVKKTPWNKNISLPKELMQELFFFERKVPHVSVTINGKKRKLRGFCPSKKPYRFRLIGNQDKLEVFMEDQYEEYYPDYHWFFWQGYFFELSFETIPQFELIYDTKKRMPRPTLTFSEEAVTDFFNVLYPVFKDIGEIELSDELFEKLVEEPLETLIHLSLNDGRVEGEVKFKYGEVVLPATLLDEETSQGLITRRIGEEEAVLLMMQDLSYAFSDGLFYKSLPEAEKLYAFFTEELPRLRQLATVTLADNLQELYLDGLKARPKIKINTANSWLDIHFDISDIAEEEVDEMIRSIYAGKTYHQLKNGQIISLEDEEYREITKSLQTIPDKLNFRNGSVRLPNYQSILLKNQFASVKDAEFSEDFEKMVTELTKPEKLTDALPKKIRADLRPYQTTGFRWLKMMAGYGFGAILADEMGLGKTLQIITYLQEAKEKGELSQSIVIVPASLVLNWKYEVEKFAPELTTAVISGSADKRKELIAKGGTKDLLITSYATFRQDVEHYRDHVFGTLILDEAQMVKNSATKTFQAIKKVSAKQRFALSGTPIENRLEEIWAIFHLIMPGFLPSFRKFQKLSTDTINKWIQPFVLRREKKGVLTELPDKIETLIRSELTKEQKKIYLAQLQDMQHSLREMDGKAFQQNRMNILAGLTRLRQICCSPALFLPDYHGGSGKLEQLKELIQSALANNRRMLLFSQFTSMLSIIEKMLGEMGVGTFYLRGSTPIALRQQMVNEFNQGSKDVFLISLKAGGTGLNLTGADTVILYDLWWNPAVEDQAASRAHRLGQKKEVEVWRLIAEGTIEEKIIQLQEDKKDLFENVLGASASQLTEQDIRDILLQ